MTSHTGDLIAFNGHAKSFRGPDAPANRCRSSGSRIAAGWNRQLRVSPLSPAAYIATKVLTGYLLAGLSILILYACGAALGERASRPAAGLP